MGLLIHKEFSVHNVLGPGLLESAYEGALVIELKQRGLKFERQQVFPVYYKGELAGAYVADSLIQGIPGSLVIIAAGQVPALWFQIPRFRQGRSRAYPDRSPLICTAFQFHSGSIFWKATESTPAVYP
jgi:hypothetical protein